MLDEQRARRAESRQMLVDAPFCGIDRHLQLERPGVGAAEDFPLFAAVATSLQGEAIALKSQEQENIGPESQAGRLRHTSLFGKRPHRLPLHGRQRVSEYGVSVVGERDVSDD